MMQRPALAVTYASDPLKFIHNTERNHEDSGDLPFSDF